VSVEVLKFPQTRLAAEMHGCISSHPISQGWWLMAAAKIWSRELIELQANGSEISAA